MELELELDCTLANTEFVAAVELYTKVTGSCWIPMFDELGNIYTQVLWLKAFEEAKKLWKV